MGTCLRQRRHGISTFAARDQRHLCSSPFSDVFAASVRIVRSKRGNAPFTECKHPGYMLMALPCPNTHDS